MAEDFERERGRGRVRDKRGRDFVNCGSVGTQLILSWTPFRCCPFPFGHWNIRPHF